MKKFNIILLILWLVTIFIFSQDNGDVSSSKSDGIANVTINIISDITGKKLNMDTCTFIIRKVAHFIEYMILGILIINVFRDYKNIDNRILIICILLCFIYACSDELHQLFIAERSARFIDVLIDTSGSFFGIFIYNLFYKNKKRLNNKGKV